MLQVLKEAILQPFEQPIPHRLAYRGHLTEAILQRLYYRGYITEAILQRLYYRGYRTRSYLTGEQRQRPIASEASLRQKAKQSEQNAQRMQKRAEKKRAKQRENIRPQMAWPLSGHVCTGVAEVLVENAVRQPSRVATGEVQPEIQHMGPINVEVVECRPALAALGSSSQDPIDLDSYTDV